MRTTGALYKKKNRKQIKRRTQTLLTASANETLPVL